MNILMKLIEIRMAYEQINEEVKTQKKQGEEWFPNYYLQWNRITNEKWKPLSKEILNS